MKEMRAFTLAEVLITLGIIGVVAAMTMPSLIANHQKQVLKNQFKKAYSEASQAALLLKAKEDINIFEYAQTYGSQMALNKLMSQISSSPLEGSKGWANFQKTIYKPKHLNKSTDAGQYCDETDVYASSNGILYSMDSPPNSLSLADPKLCIDINGKKGPNALGYDLFVFIFEKNGELVPFKYKWSVITTTEENSNIAAQCRYNSNVIPASCSYYAISDTSPIDENKSYWDSFLK